MNFSKVLLSFKWLVWALMGALVCFFVWVFVVEIEPYSATKNVKRLIIDGSKLEGYDKNVLSWLLHAKNMWVGDYDYVVFLEDAYDGNVYNDDEKVMLTVRNADSMKVNYRTKTVYAENIEVALYHDRPYAQGQVFAEAESVSENIVVRASSFKYFSSFKKAYLYGDITVQKGDSFIHVQDEMEIDLNDNIAYIENGFQFKKGPLQAVADKMTIYIDDKHAILEGNIQLTRIPEQDPLLDSREAKLKSDYTYMTADSLAYHEVSDQPYVTVTGNIRVWQTDKSFVADTAYYDGLNSTYGLLGEVKIAADSMDWLVDTDRKHSFSDDHARSAIEMAFTLNTSELEFDSSNRILKLSGFVEFLQSDKKIECGELLLDDSMGKIELKDGVEIWKKANHMQTDRLVYDWVNEVYAVDSVMEAELVIE